MRSTSTLQAAVGNPTTTSRVATYRRPILPPRGELVILVQQAGQEPQVVPPPFLGGGGAHWRA
jgi:hypothetical protein